MGATPESGRARRRVAAFFGGLRTLWMVAGVTLLMLLLLEVAYRAQAALRRSLREKRAVTTTQHPYAAEPWFEQYRVERERTESGALVWSSYVYWRRRPFTGTYINVDSQGFRVTPQPAAAAPAQPVWFFGGSTMWGTFQRDSATIPAAAARRWAERGRGDLEVMNRGEYGYVFTQEVLALELALRKGGRPAVVVFLDGLNDVAASVINDSAGLPQNEPRRGQEFRLGRLLSPDVQGTRDEPRALAATAVIVLGRLSFVQRLLAAGASRFQSSKSPAELGQETARVYAATAEWVESLAARYGFVPFYFWQPSPVSTGKPLTEFEQAIIASAPGAVAVSNRRETTRAAEAALEGAMRPVAGRRFVNLSRLFDADSSSVFLDFIGHTTETGAARIAHAIADTVLAQWNAPLPRPAALGGRSRS